MENKIKTAEIKPDISNLASKTEVANVKNSNAFVKKTDYANEITSVKNDYVTNAALKSQLIDLKNTHIADEVKKVDDKVTKNSTDILNTKSSLEHNKSAINDLEREAEVFIITLNNLTFFLNQSLNHSVETVNQLALGFQQEFTVTVKILTCFL